jgi:hypothetical protein
MSQLLNNFFNENNDVITIQFNAMQMKKYLQLTSQQIYIVYVK